MFTFNSRKKTINEVLKMIDDRIGELKKERDDIYSRLEGYAKAKDKYYTKSEVQKLESIDDCIHNLELFRISVEYM